MGHPVSPNSGEVATRSGSGGALDAVGLASRMERNISQGNLTNSSDTSGPPETSGNGLPGMQRPGSHTSLQGLEPTSDRQWEAPGKSSEFIDREAHGRASGLPLPHTHSTADGEDIFVNALGGLDLNDRGSGGNLGSLGAGDLTRRHRSHNNLGDAAEPEMRPRSLVINNLTEEISDEVLQQELESFGDVQTLYTACKGQGNVMVTFYDCMAAARAKAALSGRSVGGRVLDVDFHASPKDAQQGRVYLFNVEDGIPDQAIRGQMELYGPVMFVRKHPSVPMCREIYFQDVRVASQAYQALYGGQRGVPTISENGGDMNLDTQMLSQAPMRNVQSSHTLQNYNALREGAVQDVDSSWGGRSRSWDNSLQPNEMARMMSQSGHNYSSPDVLALLNQAPPEALDQLVRSGYLPNNSSSSSLQGMASSNALRDSQGSASNLSGLGGMSGSASHPDLAAALLAAQNESPERMLMGKSRGLTSSPLQQLPGAVSAQLSADQIAALQGSGLLSGLGQGTRRGMSTPDLTAFAQAAQVQAQLGQVQNLGCPRASVPGYGSGGFNQADPYGAHQYGSSDNLSGWGSNLGNMGGQAPGLDAATLLAAQTGFGMGNLGALQRSVSALHLQQYQQQQVQQQQQQLLLQQLNLANMNPQALAQLANLQRGSGGFAQGNQHRNKMFRGGDENPVGGRLSRRAADPAVEAERKAQQERHFAMNLDKVERGEDPRTTLMIKNIPNKYTQKMLLQTIDEQFSRMYDFFYLPIDFKNKCNVGYAFINMVKPAYIIPLMKRFNQKKWERFNSEKVCHISYARIQGKAQLVTHFQNSSLLHEDKRCRPILFRSDNELAGEQEPFPSGNAAARGHRPRSAGMASGFPDNI